MRGVARKVPLVICGAAVVVSMWGLGVLCLAAIASAPSVLAGALGSIVLVPLGGLALYGGAMFWRVVVLPDLRDG